MVAHSGPTLALLGLLALAGGMKVVSPDLTSGALRAAGLPHTRVLVRGIGLIEVLIGVSAIVLGSSILAFAAAAMYAGFAWFVVHALRHRLPISSCGCFGAAETPPSVNHVLVNIGAVLVLSAAGLFPIGPWGGIVQLTPGLAIAFIAFTAVTIYILYGILAVLPLLRPDRKEPIVRLSPTGSGASR